MAPSKSGSKSHFAVPHARRVLPLQDGAPDDYRPARGRVHNMIDLEDEAHDVVQQRTVRPLVDRWPRDLESSMCCRRALAQTIYTPIIKPVLLLRERARECVQNRELACVCSAWSATKENPLSDTIRDITDELAPTLSRADEVLRALE